MKLYGSTTSPYVRRIHLLLEGQDYDVENLKLTETADRIKLKAKNPTLKIPMLEDGDVVLFDSRVIAQYLREKLSHTPLTWEEENQITLIDNANDSFVSMFQLQRSDIDTTADRLFFNYQRERFDEVFAALDQQVGNGKFAQWNFPAMCLYCLLDWITFRNLKDYSDYTNLVSFYKQHAERPAVIASIPTE